MQKIFVYPLMSNNILRKDINSLINFLKKNPRLTQGENVYLFEKLWSKWLGIKYSVFVNSGSSANLLSITLLKHKFPRGGEIIVPPLTWVSDISSVIQNGFKPIFVDINLNTLGMNDELIIKKINKNTKAVFLSHIQGFNALSDKLLKFLNKKKIILIEDVCESHGASFKNKKLGTYGWLSNFSFYYAHHLSTIEGGMICTNDMNAYDDLIQLRSHGMVRELRNENKKKLLIKKNKLLNKDFIFLYPAYNLRNTELGGILGISQLSRLDDYIKKRNINHKVFLDNIDKEIFYTDFNMMGHSNYSFNLILRPAYKNKINKLKKLLEKNQIEFRMGSAGGGNQLRQPYIQKYVKKNEFKKYPNTEYVHFYGMYLGNYPELKKKKILKLTKILNKIRFI